jgi:hypothetical protein
MGRITRTDFYENGQHYSREVVVDRPARARASRTAAVPEIVLPELDERDREEQRYAVYAVVIARDGSHPAQLEIGSTPTLEGIGVGLQLWRDEGEITNDTRIGVLDRVARSWLINPYASGRSLP